MIRRRSLYGTAFRLCPWVVAGSLAAALAHPAAALAAGRPVDGWDVAAAALVGAITGTLGMCLLGQMVAATRDMLARAVPRDDRPPDAPTSTRALPAQRRTGLIDPDEQAARERQRREMQARLDRASSATPARHAGRSHTR